MKKLFTFLSLAITGAALAQSFSLYKTNNAQTTITATVTNNYVISDVTSPNGQTKTTLKIINNSATTLTLGLSRLVYYQNPSLILDGSTNKPNTYFCFGNTCFPSNVNVAPSTDYTILGPAGSTTLTPPADNSTANGQPFLIYVDEGTVTGKYFVRYKVYNVNNPNDTLSFTEKYNEFQSVSENNAIIDAAGDVYPNPVNNNASIALTLKQESPVKVQVYNSLGALVYSGQETKLAQGKQKISLDCSSFNSGIYFVNINAGDDKITKRMVINR